MEWAGGIVHSSDNKRLMNFSSFEQLGNVQDTSIQHYSQYVVASLVLFSFGPEGPSALTISASAYLNSKNILAHNCQNVTGSRWRRRPKHRESMEKQVRADSQLIRGPNVGPAQFTVWARDVRANVIRPTAAGVATELSPAHSIKRFAALETSVSDHKDKVSHLHLLVKANR